MFIMYFPALLFILILVILSLLQVTEIYNFTQDDLMTEDIFILDCHSEIFIWVGQQVDSKIKMQALTIGEVGLFLFLFLIIKFHYN